MAWIGLGDRSAARRHLRRGGDGRSQCDWRGAATETNVGSALAATASRRAPFRCRTDQRAGHRRESVGAHGAGACGRRRAAHRLCECRHLVAGARHGTPSRSRRSPGVGRQPLTYCQTAADGERHPHGDRRRARRVARRWRRAGAAKSCVAQRAGAVSHLVRWSDDPAPPRGRGRWMDARHRGRVVGIHSSRDQRSSGVETLTDRSRAGDGCTRRRAAHVSDTRLRNLLVAGQVATATVLLVGAGLLVNSFGRLTRVDPGWNASGLLTFYLAAPQEYTDTTEGACSSTNCSWNCAGRRVFRPRDSPTRGRCWG